MNYSAGHSYHLEDEIREIVRLREGMTETGLSESAIERGLSTLLLFKRFCESVHADSVVATATSAVREAANGPQFVERVQRETGIALRILSGEEEARYGVLGALNAIALQNGVVVDIGGGSAQLSQVKERKFQQGQALTLGALALTERFVRHDPIKKSEVKSLEDEIERQLDTIRWLPSERGPLVGLGGTIRSLAKVGAARDGFPLGSINGYALSRASLDETIHQLRELPLGQRKRIPGLVRDRADIILPGALVIRAIMERLGATELTISENGLREGLFFEHFWHELPTPVTPDLRKFSVLNLARFYGYQATHAEHVQYLACRLFDSLAPLHGYGAGERELLGAASLLHDIGLVIKYNDHHKYSQMLITSNGLPGYTPREIAIISLLTRYHRKGTPVATGYASLLRDGDDTLLAKLTSLLRLSEYLERGRSGTVRDVRARWDEEHLWLTLQATEQPTIELWSAEHNALELLEQAFGRKVKLQSATPTVR
jgi:exopolyphosphatase/guanosine-5'-triphosphate,3'-diphosphate pyrophosphatase